MLNDSSCPPGNDTPLPLERSPPGSFKRLLGSGIHGPCSLRRSLLTRLRVCTRAGPKVSSSPDVSGLCRSPSPPSQVRGDSLVPDRYCAGFTRFSRLPTSLMVMPTRTPDGSDTLGDDV